MRPKKQVFKIQIVSTQGIHIKYVEAFEFIVGRSDGADLCLQFDGVSREHIFITSKDGNIVIQDRNSSGGTYVNRQKLTKEKYYLYKPLDRIQMGKKNDLILTIRLVPKIEASHLYETDNPDFLKRLVKNDFSKAFNNWIHYKMSPEDELSLGKINKKIMVAEKEVIKNLSGILVDSKEVANAIKRNAIIESESILKNARSIGKKYQDKAKAEMENYLKTQNAFAEEIVEKSRKRAQLIERDASQAASKIVKTAESRKHMIVQKAENEVQGIKNDISLNKDKIIGSAKKKADTILNEAKSKAERTLEDAKIKAEGKYESINKKVSEIINNAKKEASEHQKKAVEYEAVANKKIDLKYNEVITKANREATALLQKAQKESENHLRESKQKFDEEVKNAREESAQLVEVSQLQAEKVVRQAHEQSAQIVNDTHNEADRIIQDATVRASEILRLEKQEFIKEQREQEEALEELKENAEKHSSEMILNAQKEKAEIDLQLSNTREKLADAEARADKIEEDIERKERVLLAKALDEAQSIKSKAQVEYEEVLAKAKQASDDIHHKIQEKKAEHSGLMADAQAMESKKQELEENLKHLVEENERAKVKGSIMKDEMNEFEQKKKKKISNLSNELDEKSELLNQLITQRDEAQTEIAKISKELKDKTQKTEAISNKLANLTVEKEKLMGDAEEKSQALLAEASEKAEKIVQKAEEQIQKLNEESSRKLKEQEIFNEKQIAADRLKAEEVLNKEVEKRHSELDQVIASRISDVLKQIEIEFANNSMGTESDAVDSHSLQKVQKIVSMAMKGDSFSDQSKAQEAFAYDLQHEKDRKQYWNRMSIGLVSLLVVASAGIYYFQEIKTIFTSAKRRVASTDQEQYVDKYIQKRKEELKFTPNQTDMFKNSYTRNVIYTKNYLSFEKDESVRKAWIIKLNTFLDAELGLDDSSLLKINSLEVNLIKDIEKLSSNINPKHEQQAVARILKKEKKVLNSIRQALGGKKNFKRFWKFKQEFYQENRVE